MVREAMRKLVTHLPKDASIEQAARYAIKYKVNAILITGENLEAIGVVSKTDLMGAYYAGLPVETAVQAIMVGPPMFCHLDDSLESALDIMRNSGIHRLYVVADTSNRAVGVLAYPDIVGLLYRYCHKCEKSITRLRGARSSESLASQLSGARGHESFGVGAWGRRYAVGGHGRACIASLRSGSDPGRQWPSRRGPVQDGSDRRLQTPSANRYKGQGDHDPPGACV